MNKLKEYFNRIYRLSLSPEKQEVLVWEDLKKLHALAGWRYGVYENEKYVETVFEIADEKPTTYFYIIFEGYYHCRVAILENYPEELTTELFVLATHFNNLLKNGGVLINVESQSIEYNLKREILIPLLYPGEIHEQLVGHFGASKDIYWACQRLIEENEAPAIIIADLLRMKETEETSET